MDVETREQWRLNYLNSNQIPSLEEEEKRNSSMIMHKKIIMVENLERDMLVRMKLKDPPEEMIPIFAVIFHVLNARKIIT